MKPKLLYIANGFPSPEQPWKCPYNLRAVNGLSRYYEVTLFETKSVYNFFKRRIRIYEGFEVRKLVVMPKVSDKRVNKLFGLIDRLLIRKFLKNSIISNDIIFSVSYGSHTAIVQKYCEQYKRIICIQLIGSEVSNMEGGEYDGSDFLNKVNLILSVSDSLGDRFTRFFPNLRPLRVYRGIDVNIPNVVQKTRGRKLRFLYLGGYIGRKYYPVDSVSQKGSDILLRAWEKFDKVSNGEFILGLGGPFYEDGFSYEWANRLAHPEAIIHLGTIDYGAVDSVLREFDFLIVPSKSEGLPSLPLEAMLTGVCVIGSDCTALRELLKVNQYGLLFKNKEVDSLFQLLYDIYLGDIEWENIADKSFDYVRQTFNSDNYGEQIHNVILNLAKYADTNRA